MPQPYNNGTTNVAPYPSMVYPLMNTAQGNRPHYFPSSLVHHQFNNTHVSFTYLWFSVVWATADASIIIHVCIHTTSILCALYWLTTQQQYVSSPAWSLVTAVASSGTNRGTPERETNNTTTVSLEMPSNRMVAARPHSPNRLSCLYGPSLPSPFLTAGLLLLHFHLPKRDYLV